MLAEDVKYTVDRMLTLKIGVWAYLTSVSGAEVLDERRVAIELFQPFAGFLGAMTRLYIVNADRIRPNEFQGDIGQRWLQNQEAGSGPYRLVSFQPGQRITVERFPGYHLGWRSRHVDRAVFRVLREEVARRIALVNGDADWIYVSSAVMLSLDIDCVDAGFVPGTGWPEPGGFLPREMLGILRGVAAEGVVGMEVVEVAPPYDISDITSLLASRAIVDVLATMVQNGHIGGRLGASEPS